MKLKPGLNILHVNKLLSMNSWHSIHRLVVVHHSTLVQIVHYIRLCVVGLIFFPQSYSRSETELYDNKSVFCQDNVEQVIFQN